MNLRKLLADKGNIILLVVVIAAIFVRFYNFPNRVSFSSEQARSLITSAEYLNKPSLLGQEYFIGHDSKGHVLFAGALFNYLLVPALLITKEVVPITALFSILNLVTGVVVYLVAKKVFNKEVGIFSAILFLFSYYMIYHSLFIWIYNPLPLIGLLTFYLTYLYFKKQKNGYILALGFLSGAGITLQYLYAPIAVIVFILIFLKSKTKLLTALSFVSTGVFANLPMIVFDLRHNFYNSQTIIQMFLDALAGRSNAETNYFVYYHFFAFWPILAIMGGWLLARIYKVNRILTVLIVLLYVSLNISSPKVNFNGPTSTPGGLTVTEIDKASKRIAEDAKNPFNLVEVLDFDGRAFMLRYFVEIKYGKKSMGVEDYPNAKLLYVLAPKDYNFRESFTWEIKSGWPYSVAELTDASKKHTVYKLTK